MIRVSNKTVQATTNVGDAHAHLLITETGGLMTVESPAEVMAEVEFRANHLSSLMEEMYRETMRHDWWDAEET